MWANMKNKGHISSSWVYLLDWVTKTNIYICKYGVLVEREWLGETLKRPKTSLNKQQCPEKHIWVSECPLAPGPGLKACCQIHFQPLNLRSCWWGGLYGLLIVKLHLTSMEHQRATLLPLCIEPQSLQHVEWENKQWGDLNRAVHHGGWEA